jgi:RimJ/RimL family protein N-acetyltransferase
MGDILFFALDCDCGPPPVQWDLPNTTVKIWRPGRGDELIGNLPVFPSVVYLIFHYLRVFANRDHAVVWICNGGACVQRTLLMPRYFRFPFMGPNDLQCGGIWTDPLQRGRGLAKMGVAAAVARAWRPGRRIWYLTKTTNVASCRLAESVGFVPVGHGVRTRPLGLGILGRFLMTSQRKDAR